MNPETTLALALVILECRASSTVGSDPRAGRREGKKVKEGREDKCGSLRDRV